MQLLHNKNSIHHFAGSLVTFPKPVAPGICRSPLPWVIGGLRYDTTIFIALRTGRLQHDMSLPPFVAKIRSLLTLAILLQFMAVTIAQAADVSVKAEINSTEFSIDQSALLKITVSGARSAKPEMPEADGLRFTYQGQQSQTQWINGKTSSSISFSFMIQADKEGKHTIKPVKVTVDGKVYTTKAVPCTVLPPRAPNVVSKGRLSTQPQKHNAPSARLRSGEADKIGYMRVFPEKEKIYPGQLVFFTIKAYFRQGLRVTLKSSPRFVGENFMLQSLDDKPQQSEELVNGNPYISLTWKGALSAVKEGTFPLEVEMDAELLVRTQRQRQNNPFGSPFLNDPFFDDFFGQYSRREVKVASPDKSITVMDLPMAGRPNDFQGGIGTFSLAVAASPVDGKVGDPITLKMIISGTGNFDTVQAPQLTNNNDWKTYSATENFEKHKPGSGKKTFEQAIVPTSPALKTIPSVQFSYFDPDAGEYVSLTSDPIKMQLKNPLGVPTAADKHDVTEQQPTTPSPPAKPNTKNLAPLHTDPGRLVHAIGPLYKKSWFILFMTAAFLCLTTALLLNLRRKRLQADPTILLHKQVNRQLSNHYQEMEKAISSQDQNSFFNHCRAAIQKRLGEIWGQEPRAITLSDLQQRLPADAPLLDIFTRMEHGAYSGERLDQTTLEKMLQTTRNELDKL